MGLSLAGCSFRNRGTEWDSSTVSLPPVSSRGSGACFPATTHIARTSCVCGRLAERKAQAGRGAASAAPAAAAGMRLNTATWGSTPAAKTVSPSGAAARVRTSAECVENRESSVPKRPSQNCTLPALSPDTRVPSGRNARAHTHASALRPLASPAVMRSSSRPEDTPQTWMQPSVPAEARDAPSGCHATASARPSTRGSDLE